MFNIILYPITALVISRLAPQPRKSIGNIENIENNFTGEINEESLSKILRQLEENYLGEFFCEFKIFKITH